MLHASGEYVLMVDADGATRFSDIEKLETQMKRIEKKGTSIGVGSRAHMVQSEAVVKVMNCNGSICCSDLY
jgi:dolichyl-phosphate beta-glucosyltransferase